MKTTLKKIALMALALSPMTSFADGFVCETREGDLNVKVYNNTHASEGTRNVAVMIVSDPSVGSGRKTIARFTDVDGTVSSRGASFVAEVDLRFADSRRKGELILGTKLGHVDRLILDVDFSYAAPADADEVLPATLTLVKRDGQVIEREAECARYLKN